MTVRASGLGSARNGRPMVPYRNAGQPEPRSLRVTGGRRGPQPGVPRRALAALRSLKGEGSTTDIRLVMEMDGGPEFAAGSLGPALIRLAQRGEVTAEGRGGGSGRAARWRLPGAGGTG